MGGGTNRKAGLGKSERRILALRRRLVVLAKELRDIQKEQEENYFSDGSIFAVFFFLAFLSGVLSLGLVWSMKSVMSWGQLSDLVAYALPCIGAILGGMGIYFKKHTTPLFITAGLFVFGGFVSYTLSKAEYLQNVMLRVWLATTGFTTLLAILTLILVERVRKKEKGDNGWRDIKPAILVGGVIAGLVAGFLIWYALR